MIALRPRDQHVWDPRPVPHETEAESETNYCKTETKKWSRDQHDLNIPGNNAQKEIHLQ